MPMIKNSHDDEINNSDEEFRNSDDKIKHTDGENKNSDNKIKLTDGVIKNSDNKIKNSDGETKNSDNKIKPTDGVIKNSDNKIKNSDGETKNSDNKIKYRDRTVIRFPDDIIENINLRMSPKELLRFKGISKSWMKKIVDPDFIQLHLKRALSFQRNKNFIVIYSPDDDYKNGRPWFNLRYGNTGGTGGYVAERVGFLPNFHGYFKGSCNSSLLCFVGFTGGIYVLNPFTKQCNRLNGPKWFYHSFNDAVVGIGHDPTKYSYKLVLISSEGSVGHECSKVSVCTLCPGEDSWHVLRTTIPKRVSSSAAVTVNHTLHWVGSSGDPLVFVVVGFDVKQEIIRLLLPPKGFNKYPYLGQLNDCLSISGFSSEDKIEIWLMTDYGDRESWRKHYNIDFASVGRPCIKVVKTICVQEDDHILIQYGQFLYTCNPLTMTLKKVLELLEKWKSWSQ